MTMELAVNYEGEDRVLQFVEKDIITFREGLVGLPKWRRFVLLEDPDESPVSVLQSIDDTQVSFLVTDPAYVASDYAPNLPEEDLKELGLGKAKDGQLLCILAVKEGPVVVTANLLGPIVVNGRTRVAKQVVLQSAKYSAQYPVLVARVCLEAGRMVSGSL